jgi:hypothetical protein
MPRIRTLKPELWQDEDIGALSRDARLLFIGLITQADDEGRLVGAPRLLWSQIFPWDDYSPERLGAWLTELAGAGLVRQYESGGRAYIHLPGWKRHQKISHPAKSKLPRPPGKRARPRAALRKPPEDSGDAPKRSPLIGSDQGSERIGSTRGTPDVPTPETSVPDERLAVHGSGARA